MALVAALLSVVWQCNDIVPTISAIIFAQASAMQAPLFRRLTDNDVSFQYCCRYFFSSTVYVLSTQLPGGVPLSGPLQPFCGPLAAIFNFAGGS